MDDSILNTIKRMLGIGDEEAQNDFDEDVMVHINTAIQALTQLGVGPEDGYMIEGSNETWTDFIGAENKKQYQPAKTYIYGKVKKVFDPPTSSIALQALEESIKEAEWRLNWQYEISKKKVSEDGR